jgi:hypothetical protein
VGIVGEGGRGVCSGMNERARRRGKGALAVLCPFYRRRSCSHGEWKWGLGPAGKERHAAA